MRPEKNNYFSLGAEYSNDRLFVSGTAYGNYFRDKIEGVWRIYDMQYNFEYTNLSQQRLLGLEVLARWSVLDCLTLNGTYSFVDVSKNKGIQVNTTSPHAATASMDYKYMKKNYRLNAVFSASYMGGKKEWTISSTMYLKHLAQGSPCSMCLPQPEHVDGYR